MKEQKSLYRGILEELRKMDTIIVRTHHHGQSALRNINEFGTITIGYRTEKVPYLFGLIKIAQPLSSLREVQETLEQNLGLDRSSAQGEHHLFYSRVSAQDSLKSGNLWSNPRPRILDMVEVVEEGSYMDMNR